MTPRRPGIIARLSNLIVVQVVFIFVALALILFLPDYDHHDGARLVRMNGGLYQAGRLATEFICSESGTGGRAGDSYAPLAELLPDLAVVDRAALLRLVDSSSVEVTFAYQAAPEDLSDVSLDQDVSAFCDQTMLRQIAAERHPTGVSSFMDGEYLAHYWKLPTESADSPNLLVLAVEHGLSVSSRSNLQYAILVLFLCSTLISLLTVSLLMRKFKRPLDRIVSGFEETAEGKLHHLAELETDPQLGKLARAYNRMVRKLWDNRKELDAYVTRLAGANTKLTESQSFLTTLIDCSPLSVVVTDPSDTILIFSRAAADVFGYAADELIGEPVQVLVAGEVEQSWDTALQEGQQQFEVICRRADGEPFPVYVVASRIETEQDGLVAKLYVCRDITESRNFQEMMIRLDRYYTRGEMAGDIAHEINNYLAVLMGNLELLPLLLKKGNMEKVDKKLEVMKIALDNIARFSDGLLDTPPETVNLEPTSLNQVVENVIGFLKPQNTFDMADVGTELSADIPILHVEPMQIQQLLVNLICNAAEAVAEKKDGRAIRVVTRPAEVDGRTGAQIIVRDNGPGVAAEKEQLLFDTRFTTKRRGHGIGLITCRKIVDNHSGDIGYQNDNGAVFTVFLPAKAVDPQEDQPISEKAVPVR